MELNLTLIFIAISTILSIVCFKNYKLLNLLINDPYRIKRDKSFYRLLTAGLIHADYIHLLVNMFVMFQFGSILEIYFNEILYPNNNWYFGILCLAGIIIPNFINFLKHQDDPSFKSLGFSGAVSAVLFSYILFDPLNILLIYGIIPMPAIIAAILYIIYSIYANGRKGDRIDHLAHLSGALTGVLLTTLFYPPIIKNFMIQITSFLE